MHNVFLHKIKPIKTQSNVGFILLSVYFRLYVFQFNVDNHLDTISLHKPNNQVDVILNDHTKI